MNEKEMNLAILNKLYEIAFAVWAKMAKVADFGGYTAKEVHKGLGSIFCFTDEQNPDEKVTINVDNYECSLPISLIFKYVSIFEGLAKVGKDARQFVFEKSGECLGSVTLLLEKGMQELCKFVGKDELRPVLNYIILDAANKCMVATDGGKLLSFPVEILESQGDVSNFYINPKQFSLMCKKTDKGGGYIVTATKSKVGCKEYSKLEFHGISSNMEHVGIYPNWKKAIHKVSNELAINLGKYGTWKEIKKFTKNARNSKFVFVSGKSGGDCITLEYGGCKREFIIGNVLEHDFRIALLNDTLKMCEQIDVLYLGHKAHFPLVGTNKQGKVYLFTPGYIENEDGQEETFVNCEGKDITFDIDVLEERKNKEQPGSTESIEVNNDNTANEVAQVQKVEPIKQTKEQKSKVSPLPKVATLDADSKKFTFDKVGVEVGDVLTFVDGTEVIAAENNMIEFCGETFTLSGFCKEFMPEEKRSKSNCYRGCAYFFLNGVKLEKLFKEYQKAQAVALEGQVEEVASELDVTLDDVPKKVAEIAQVSEKSPEPTITPSAKIVAISAKETVPKASVLILDVGTLAKVVAISLGVPPERMAVAFGASPTIFGPPNIFGVLSDNVGGRRNNAAVGCFLGVAGKVVHTLPLPPPGRKKTNELTTYTNYYNTS